MSRHDRRGSVQYHGHWFPGCHPGRLHRGVCRLMAQPIDIGPPAAHPGRYHAGARFAGARFDYRWPGDDLHRGVPVAFLNQALINGLKNLRGANAAVLGLIIGLFMAIDMGGPINKAAYAFSVGLLLDPHNPVTQPMAAAMAAGMTPPLVLALATVLFKNR